MKRSALIVLLVLFLCPAANATLINGSFETGNFTGWASIGDASIQSSSSGVTPTDGNFQAIITNAHEFWGGSSGYIDPISDFPAVGSSELSAFLSLSRSYISDSILVPPLNDRGNLFGYGSAIQTNFYGHAGDMLSLDYNYLTSDGYNWDAAFLCLTSPDMTFIYKLAGNNPELMLSPPIVDSATVFTHETGWLNFSLLLPNTNTYSLSIAVSQVSDNTYDSGAVIDNVRLSVPEPSTFLLLSWLPIAVFFIRRKSFQN
jgi:hypothetical protein